MDEKQKHKYAQLLYALTRCDGNGIAFFLRHNAHELPPEGFLLIADWCEGKIKRKMGRPKKDVHPAKLMMEYGRLCALIGRDWYITNKLDAKDMACENLGCGKSYFESLHKKQLLADIAQKSEKLWLAWNDTMERIEAAPEEEQKIVAAKELAIYVKQAEQIDPEGRPYRPRLRFSDGELIYPVPDPEK